MELESDLHGGTQIVTVRAPRIDAAVAIRFKDDMRDITEAGAPRIVLDLAQVDFVDSSGLGAIVAAMKRLGPEQRMELAGLTPVVEKVFRLTRMDTVFRIHADVEGAMQHDDAR